MVNEGASILFQIVFVSCTDLGEIASLKLCELGYFVSGAGFTKPSGQTLSQPYSSDPELSTPSGRYLVS